MRHTLIAAIALLILLASPTWAAINILSYGAVLNLSTEAASLANVAALQAAFAAANAFGNTDRVVLVPAGNFVILNITTAGLVNVTLQIEGTITLNSNRSLWPQVWNDGGNWGALEFVQASALTVIGTGPDVHVNGQGYDWWWHVITTGQDVRPHMFVFYLCEYLQVLNLSVINSPQFHFYASDIAHSLFKNVSIVVQAIQKDLPIFPLNTDGIDPSGTNITIEDSYIENYDDAVAVKSQDQNSHYGSCSTDIVVRRLHVKFGVGLTIGSVTPSPAIECIQGVIFEDCYSEDPLKGIYIKSNPGNEGQGIIRNITYSNITAVRPLWEPIWIGPQQEQQPHQPSKGCSFFYPIDPTCPTNPLVTIADIYLRNVHMSEVLLDPGVLLANASNPFSGFEWENVTISGIDIVSRQWICINADGTNVFSHVSPTVACKAVNETVSRPAIIGREASRKSITKH